MTIGTCFILAVVLAMMIVDDVEASRAFDSRIALNRVRNHRTEAILLLNSGRNGLRKGN